VSDNLYLNYSRYREGFLASRKYFIIRSTLSNEILLHTSLSVIYQLNSVPIIRKVKIFSIYIFV